MGTSCLCTLQEYPIEIAYFLNAAVFLLQRILTAQFTLNWLQQLHSPLGAKEKHSNF